MRRKSPGICRGFAWYRRNMRKPLLALVAIIALGAGAYLLLTNRPEQTAHTATSTPTQQLSLTTATIKEDADLYSIDIEYPHFNNPAIDATIDGLVRRGVAEFKADAVATDHPPTTKYELTGRFDTPYMDDDVASARLLLSHYTGGAHPNTIVYGLNYDSKTGAVYVLDDALRLTGLTLQQLSVESLRQLNEKAADEIQFPGGAEPRVENYGAFVIGEDDVTFFFQQYQVAAYAAGILKVTVPRK